MQQYNNVTLSVDIMNLYSQNGTYYCAISMYVIGKKYLQVSAQDLSTHVDCGMWHKKEIKIKSSKILSTFLNFMFYST